MTAATLLFIPAGEANWRWMRVANATVTDHGEGLPETLDDVVAVAPAGDVTLHWADLPDRSAAQGVAAARILAAEASATPIGDLHIAVGREDSLAERAIGVVAVDRMRQWLAMLAQGGIDPVAILPAPMLLPRPIEGWLRAELGGAGVVRGVTSGFADEARLTELVTGGVAPETMARDAIDAAIVAAVTTRPLDLRQGLFARRRRTAIDWALIRRLGVLIGLILLATLAIDLVRIAKYSFGADSLEARADALARTGLRRGETVADAERQLAARLSSVRGPGEGFSRIAAAVFAAVRATPGAEVTAMTFDPNGDLRVTLATEGTGPANAVRSQLERAGLAIRMSPFATNEGRASGEMTVSAP